MRYWLLSRFHAYGQLCLMGAIFLSAVMFAPLPVDTFNLVKLTVLWTLGVVALGLWGASRMAGKAKPPRARLFYPAAAFVLFLFVSTTFSASPRFSLIGHYTRYGGLLPYLSYVMLAFAVYAFFWERPIEVGRIARSAYLASVVVAGYVLIQEAGLDWRDWRNPGGDLPVSPTSTLGNSNFAGGYLATTLPLTIYSVASARSSRSRILSSGLLALHLLALWYTQARGAMVGAVAGLLIFCLSYRDRIPLWAKATILSGLMLLSGLAVVAIWHPGTERPPRTLKDVRQLDSFSLQTRFWYWAAAGEIFWDHPLVGTGPDTFHLFYPQYRLAEDGKTMGLNLTDKPHNVVLEHLSNAGALGGGAYVLTIGLGLWYGYRRSTQVKGGERVLLVSLTSALTAYLTQSLFSIDVPPLAVMCWILLGAIAAAADPATLAARGAQMQPEHDVAPEETVSVGATRLKLRRAFVPVAYVSLFGLMIGAIELGTRPLRADIRAAAGRAQEAIKLNPWEGEYYIRAGDTLRSIAAATRDPSLALHFYDQAERQYEKALSIQPGNLIYMMKAASLYSIRSQRGEPIQVIEANRRWRRILDLNPTDRDVKIASESASRAQRRVVEKAEESVRQRPDEVQALIHLGRLYLELGRFEDAHQGLAKAVTLDPRNAVAQKLLQESTAR